MDKEIHSSIPEENTPPKPREDRYRALFENSTDAILIIENGKFVDCNKATVEMLRYKDKKTVLQTHPSQLSPDFQPDGRSSYDKANEMMAIAVKKGSHRFEWDHMRANGEVFPVEVLLTVIPSDDGEHRGTHIHTVWRDISERKQLENQLRHSHKMEAVGKLAGGIAHDFNNQLVPILGYCELLREELGDVPELAKYVEEINRAGERASALVNRLMGFSRKDERQKVNIDLNELISGLLSIVGQLIGEDISLSFTACGQPLLVSIDPGDMEQIILNMATNARDAMPEGGEISISLSLVKKPAGDFARLEVADRGIGMDENTRAQVFVPFFTTKKLGVGTGLGMSSAYELVKQARGSISVNSEPGQGSTFEVCLPIAEGPVTEVPKPSAPSPGKTTAKISGRPARILVVEDDEQISELIDKVLTGNGYQVDKVSSGDAALDRLELALHPDLILTDIVMPGTSGPKMVRLMRDSGLDIPVLFMSGYTDDRLAMNDFNSKEIPLLRKPFTPSGLLAYVDGAVEDLKTGKLPAPARK